MVLNLIFLLIGAVIMVGGICFGILIATHTGNHFVNSYVKKLTPKDLKELHEVEQQPYVDEDMLNARGISEADYLRELELEIQKPDY